MPAIVRCVLLLERGREERPDLPEDHRQREQEAGVEADPDRGEERLGDAERDQASRRSGGSGLLEPVDAAAVERVGDAEAGGERDQADDEPARGARRGARPASPLRRSRGAAASAPQAGGVGCRGRWLRARGVAAVGLGDERPRRGLSLVVSSSSLPVIESLNSRIPLPSDLPISGSRFGPNTSSTTTSRMASSQGRSSQACSEDSSGRRPSPPLLAGDGVDPLGWITNPPRIPDFKRKRARTKWHCSSSRTCTSRWRTAPRSSRASTSRSTRTRSTRSWARTARASRRSPTR